MRNRNPNKYLVSVAVLALGLMAQGPVAHAGEAEDILGHTSLDIDTTISDLSGEFDLVTEELVHVIQEGSRNRLEATQKGKSLVRLNQLGDDNSIKVSQEGLENQILLQQKGNHNAVNVDQVGDHNKARLTQDGDGNGARITQSGLDNQTLINQQGNDLRVYVGQFGDGNIAVVKQYD